MRLRIVSSVHRCFDSQTAIAISTFGTIYPHHPEKAQPSDLRERGARAFRNGRISRRKEFARRGICLVV